MSQSQPPLQPQPRIQLPPPVQDGVLPQVAGALPDKMPDGWLDQIKSVLKPSWWAVIVSSSLLATAISSGVSFYIAIKNNEANKQLEQLKSGLELQKETVRSRMMAYTRLGQNLDVLAMKLEGFEDFMRIAQRSSISANTGERIQEQLRGAGLAVRDVITARHEPLLSESELAKAVDESMKDVSPTLADARLNPVGALPHIRPAIEKIRELIPRIYEQSLKEIETIH
jgi:hypothetical protein